MGLQLCMSAIYPKMPLIALGEMSLAEKKAMIILFYLKYSFAVISLITGCPGSRVSNTIVHAIVR